MTDEQLDLPGHFGKTLSGTFDAFVGRKEVSWCKSG